MAALRKVAARLMPERLERPLGSPSFRRLALGKSISYLGDWLMVAVLVGWVYQSTSSVAQVALLMAIRLVPPIVGGGLAASLVDRLPRRRVLIWSEAASAATIVGALVGVMAGSRPAVFAFVGLCGLVSMVSTVARNARHGARQRDAAEVHDEPRSRRERLRVGARGARRRHDLRRGSHRSDRREGRAGVAGSRPRCDGLPLLRLRLVRQCRHCALA